jgi:hypothetical protein
MSSLYPLFDVFFEVVSVKKLWVPVGNTFCNGSITLRHRDTLKTNEEYEIFFYLDDRETVEVITERYKHNICRWCRLYPSELTFIIKKEWERNIQLEDV